MLGWRMAAIVLASWGSGRRKRVGVGRECGAGGEQRVTVFLSAPVRHHHSTHPTTTNHTKYTCGHTGRTCVLKLTDPTQCLYTEHVQAHADATGTETNLL